MTTTKKWGAGILVLSTAGLLAFLAVTLPEERSNQILAQDAKLISAATMDHPTDVFSLVQRADSLPQAFQAAGVEYFPEDEISSFPDPKLGLGTVITVRRALPVIVIDGKKSRVFRTWQTKVADLLKEKKIELGADDKIAPIPTSNLAKDMTVTIVRVARTNVTETETVPFQTTIDKDYNQFVGAQTVIKAGQSGQLEKTYLLVREDGELKSKTLINKKTTKPAVTAVVRQGGLDPVPKHCLSLKDWVVSASTAQKVDPNALYHRIVRESNCHPNSHAAAGYQGLLQYDPSFWSSVSAKAGHAGASIWDAKSQIYVTAWAWSHGYRGRWPSP